MLRDNETALETIVHLFNHPHFTLNHQTAQALQYVEENMATLDLSDSNMDSERMDPQRMSIGARIMRQLRKNQPIIEKPTDDLKKKNPNSKKAIEKLYLNKSLGRVKHTQLETIFEHEDETDANENFTIEESKVFGKRKIKRAMSCTDGFKASKTLKQKRKKRIQKIFGVHKKLKSISMKKFLEHLQASDSVKLVTSQPAIEEARLELIGN